MCVKHDPNQNRDSPRVATSRKDRGLTQDREVTQRNQSRGEGDGLVLRRRRSAHPNLRWTSAMRASPLPTRGRAKLFLQRELATKRLRRELSSHRALSSTKRTARRGSGEGAKSTRTGTNSRSESGPAPNDSGHLLPRNQAASTSEARRKEDLRGQQHALVGRPPHGNKRELLNYLSKQASRAGSSGRDPSDCQSGGGTALPTRPTRVTAAYSPRAQSTSR